MPEIEFPGIFIQEIPNGVHAIAGVSTSKAAFIGRAFRGEVDQPIEVTSFAEFEQVFGVRHLESALAFVPPSGSGPSRNMAGATIARSC